MDFPQLTMTLPDGREESIMKRTTLVRTLNLRASYGGACLASQQMLRPCWMLAEHVPHPAQRECHGNRVPPCLLDASLM